MDEFDLAQERETQERAAIIARRKRFPLPASAPTGETVYCIDCDEPIPFARLAAVPFTQRCTDCEAGSEHAVTRGSE